VEEVAAALVDLVVVVLVAVGRVVAGNILRCMRTFLLITFCFFFSLYARAQSSYFVYLQTEPAQSFTVKYKEQTLRSSASGYLILSNLVDSVLQLVIDFPGQKDISYRYTLTTDRSDQGYLLKNYGDKGWGLLDWRKLSVTYVDRTNVAKPDMAATGTDDFSKLLAKASGDSTLLIETPLPAPTNQRVKPTVDSATPPIMNSPVATPPVTNAPIATPPITNTPVAPLPVANTTVTIPTYCKSILTDNEFKEGLNKVQAAKSETSKLGVLKEFIASRCYTISQVREFALLLTTDEVKYDFLLEAWAQTADRSQYISLSTVFSNAVTADRFKEMFQ
jgi:hypothetical protein